MERHRRSVTDIIMNSEGIYISFFVFQRCIEYIVRRCIVPLAKRTEHLRPAKVHANLVIKHIFRIQRIVEVIRISRTVSAGRFFIITVMGITKRRSKIPFIR